jgi:predicted ferric reductase
LAPGAAMRRVSPKGQPWQARATVRIIRGPMGYGIAAQRKSIGRGHNSLSLVRQSSLVIRQPVTDAKGAGAGAASVRTRRPGPAPRPGFVTGCAALAGLGFGVAVGTVVIGESRGSLAAPGGLLTAAGRLAGFTGAYLMLIMVVLAARLPWLEVSVGQDRLIGWHRRVAPWAFGLIAAHVGLITLGYAQAAQVGVLRQLWVFVTSYPDLLAAIAGFGLLVMAGVTSIRLARRRLKYETWWVVHLYIYLGLALAFAHQIVTGVPFIGHPLTRAVWIAVWACTAGMVIVFRVAQPIWRSVRHQLRVIEVREEAPGVVSVICQGRRLDRLAVSGGQFFLWRFLTRDLWWQAHPYSLSALPQPPYLRVTIKALGDQSHAVPWLRPGTRVAIEGPYGAFTRHARIYDRVVLIGAGVGITPLRALLEDLPAGTDVVVIVRASSPRDLIHRDEVAALVGRRGGRLHEIVGSRRRVRFDAPMLRRLVPDLAVRDVYVCGPDRFSADVIRAASRLGAAQEQIHREAFGF